MIKVDELINIYKSVDLNKFLKKYTGLTLEENNLTLSKIQTQWKFLGNNSSNASAVGILTNGEKGLIERITNAIDAVIEKQKAKFNIGVAKNSDVIIKKAFPKFYENKVGVAKGTIDTCTPSFMNGRIQYAWDAKTLKPGVHQIQFRYFKDSDSLESNILVIEILDKNMPETKKKENEKALDLKINIVSEQELICDISKNKETGSIIANLCLETDDMVSDVYGFNSAAEKIKETQSKIIKPIVLFTLFMGESYDSIESANKKNKLIVSFVRSFLTSSQLVL